MYSIKLPQHLNIKIPVVSRDRGHYSDAFGNGKGSQFLAGRRYNRRRKW